MMPRNIHVSLTRLVAGLVFGLASLAGGSVQADRGMAGAAAPGGTPPFSGTIFIDPDIITASDPTTFVGAPYAGQGMRTMFDRRVNDWIEVNAYLFNASFSDGLAAEIQVNPEFGSSAAAQTEALFYGEVIGQLPRALRADLETVWIHMGVNPFGGGNNNLLIHTGQGALYDADGILEETFVHEAAHTSLDAAHAAAPGWLAAQSADGNFISDYAQDYPDREDVAESFLTWLAVRYRLGRISPALAQTISDTIPNRLAYFDGQGFQMAPVALAVPLAAANDFALTAVNTPVTIHPLGNDGGPGSDPFTMTAVGAPSDGTASLAGLTLIYTPTLAFVGSDSFTYTISSATENASATVTVLVAEEVFRLFAPLIDR